MMLCLDVGNSHIYGGLFAGEDIRLRFRLGSQVRTSDEIGIFLKSVLRENNCSPESVKQISICSVVPQIDYSLRSSCMKYFDVDPFILQAGVRTGLNIHYRNPLEVGADRIANAIAGARLYPQQNLIIIDFGTATTFCAVSQDKVYHGGVIIPGIRLSTEALTNNTAKLPNVEIVKKDRFVGRTTIESIQSGVYYAALGACREIIAGMQEELFAEKAATIIATGGFASLFESKGLFDSIVPDLVLQGIRFAALVNS